MKTPHEAADLSRAGAFRDATLLWLVIPWLLAGGVTVTRGQSALDGFDPNANGAVKFVVVQPDGKILIGGNFTIVLGMARNGIARLNPDGGLDQGFDPSANGFVNAIALQADGKILVGGNFSSIGGQTRTNIARLDATNGLADAFNPNAANGQVLSFALQADGKILVGGNFTSIGGQARNLFARLDSTNGQADSFNLNVTGGFNQRVLSILVQADGKIMVGGTFTSIGGQARTNIARLDATTGLPDSFSPNATGAFVTTVYSIAVQADGKILAGGTFSSIGGQTRNGLARLDATTGLADSFNANLGGSAYAVAVQPDGKILVGGGFSIGGQRNDLARLDPTTGLADSFDPNANSEVYSIALQTDGKVLVGGGFTTLSPNGGGAVTRNNIARLETDGRLDRTLNLGIVGDYVLATAVQPDGKILIGGNFTSVLGLFRNNIARLNTDGTLDTNFNPNANNIVESIAVQADGKIIAAGDFTDIGGANRNYIARLDATTGLADSFNPNANSVVAAIAVQADGKILVGGNFTVIGGTNRNLMARLNPTNGLADSFNPNASGNPSFFPGVNSIAVQADGKILAGGNFTVIGGTNRNLIARLDPTNGLADSFNPNASGIPSFSLGVNAIAVQTDGKILAGGDFTVIGGTNRNCIARLDATTGLADSFNPNANSRVFTIAVQTDGKILLGGAFNGTNSIGGTNRNYIARLDPNGVVDAFNPNANNWVAAIAVQTDGKIMAGGYFASIGGQTRSRFARLGNDTAALQNLALSQNTITWTRDGSSPQLTRAIFEYSTNSVNYTPLGNATAAGSNWTLTGLNLPTGTNIYIRARGFYRGGYLNGSQSIHESVRNVFLTPQPRLNIQRSATTNVVVSWATNFPGFTLEAKTNLNTNVWSVVTNAPAVRGTNNVVTNATSGAARFYRLRQ